MNDTIHYIKRVEIQGLWQKFDIVWDLNPDVNILAGVNGSGKTTVINIMYFSLLGHDINRDFNKIEEINFVFNDNQKILSDLIRMRSFLIKDSNKHTKKPFDYQVMNAVTERFAEKTKEVKELEGFSTNSVFNNILNTIDIINTFDIPLKQSKEVQKLSNDTVKTELDWKIYHLQKEYLDYQLNISKRKDQIIENSDNVKTEIEKINYPKTRFLKILDDLFSETGKKVDRDKNEISFLLDEQPISAFQLSSGEKQLLIILLTVLVQDNKPSILFMDEPEISLHIDWQRKLIQYIRELNPNVQIILATHSPDIIMEGWLDKVFEISDLIVNKQAV